MIKNLLFSNIVFNDSVTESIIFAIGSSKKKKGTAAMGRGGGGAIEELSEDERRALRGSKFAPLTSLPSSSRSQPPRLAHPGGPLKTNKAAALAKFLERKLQDPNGLSSIDPDLLELALKNARATVISSGASSSGRTIQHVASFEDVEVSSDDDKIENTKLNKKKKKKNTKKKKDEKKKKKNKKHKIMVDEDAKLKRPKKKLKL